MLKWVHNLSLDQVDFEPNSKLAVDNFHFNKYYMLLSLDKLYLNVEKNSIHFMIILSFEFIKQQINKVAHSLAKTTTYVSVTNFQILVEIPIYIKGHAN
jgi:hypothetical protein